MGAPPGPGWILMIGMIGNDRGVRLVRIPHPDPQECVLFDQWEMANARSPGYLVLCGDMHAGTVRAEFKAMIGAANALPNHYALAQRHGPMAAAILERRDFAAFGAKQHERLPQYGSGGPAPWLQFMSPARDIPDVMEE